MLQRLRRRDNVELFDWARVVWWLLLTPLSYYMGWLDKVSFVSLLSIWALVESAWAARQASAHKKEIAAILECVNELRSGRKD